ncbi:hypothetical protein L195_g030934 [Trifolium pratense]|uniref:Uncharacterized protein n=1 Tax=Trifolium pratense TaxID=57577 RepID=A0A2K3L906_TRIPR|nr:hypothetical protein L195_g030934 [Trifolium pratense]
MCHTQRISLHQRGQFYLQLRPAWGPDHARRNSWTREGFFTISTARGVEVDDARRDEEDELRRGRGAITRGAKEPKLKTRDLSYDHTPREAVIRAA